MTSCAGHGLLPCVKFLQRIGIDPNVADKTGDTALKAARWSAGSWSRSGAPASVRKMEAMIRHLSPLRRGARMRWMQAAERGNVAELQRHLEAGQKVDAKDARGRTALLVAVDNGDAKAVKLLLDHGANPALAAESFCNLNDLDFDPARAAFLELLLDYGLDPSGGHRGMGSYVEKAVLLAVDGTGKGRTRGNEDVLKRRDVKRKGDWSDATCLKMLLNAGADVAQVQRERSPGLLLYPIGNGDHPLARFLVKRGCDVNHPCGSDKTTPLMHAAEFGEVADIELLVELGADIKAKDRRGRTALALAASRPRQHAHGVVELLRTLGNDEPNKKSRRL